MAISTPRSAVVAAKLQPWSPFAPYPWTRTLHDPDNNFPEGTEAVRDRLTSERGTVIVSPPK